MSSPKDGPATHAVDDPEAAFRKLEEFTRKVLAVPKAEIDKRLTAEKARKKRGKRP